ncbi:MAG: hypothetical protein Hyperionvirus3_99 [Hyperionvirus sp.]|uniref:Uncharacterized protein n=1 Tax=Hyperionvirus sp. TaxID=2487770 RepID=A0A3G5AAV2_9VIRU|nr:MAG: hypothetical protein Hyperionvirus3_99 [Hyperionvirus sp.]
MGEYSVRAAFEAGLKVGPICSLGLFTEDDEYLSFHRIDSRFEYIAEGLKWQWIDIISEDFLSSELCYFMEGDGGSVFFFPDSHNSEIAKTRFLYALTGPTYSPRISDRGTLSYHGPEYIKISVIEKQLESIGFIVWEGHNPLDRLRSSEKKGKYGTFRNFYPNVKVHLVAGDKYLRCEHNMKKGIKYLKLLHKSYVARLGRVFDRVPNVLLDIICYYVLGDLVVL